jgi:hypothetical protein
MGAVKKARKESPGNLTFLPTVGDRLRSKQRCFAAIPKKEKAASNEAAATFA